MSRLLRLAALILFLSALTLASVGCGGSSDASLQSLTITSVNQINLLPEFRPTVFDYTALIPTLGSSCTATISAAPTGSQATMCYQVEDGSWVDLEPGTASTGITLLPNETAAVRVQVTAPDGITVRVYTISVTVITVI